jgi:hypothetical protein
MNDDLFFSALKAVDGGYLQIRFYVEERLEQVNLAHLIDQELLLLRIVADDADLVRIDSDVVDQIEQKVQGQVCFFFVYETMVQSLFREVVVDPDDIGLLIQEVRSGHWTIFGQTLQIDFTVTRVSRQLVFVEIFGACISDNLIHPELDCQHRANTRSTPV